ncbi:MAG: hypothetical protein K8T20_15275, partial [Planctomycetes bacterium]|nr:hypothetical protein [Planctomycetota bacterium]
AAKPHDPPVKPKDPPAKPKDPPVKRPVLLRQQGQYFAWSMPAGWKFNETANGVDVYAPDQKAGAGVSVVFNYPGRTTPSQVIDTCNQIVGINDATTVSEKNLPDGAGYAGIPWKLVERDFKYTYAGLKARRKCTAGVQSYGNGFHAAVGYYACEASRWDEQSTWLAGHLARRHRELRRRHQSPPARKSRQGDPSEK